MTEKTIGLYPAPVVPGHCELKLLTRMTLSASVAYCGADSDEPVTGIAGPNPQKSESSGQSYESRFE